MGNFTVRLAPLEAVPLAGSTADAFDDATQVPSATQSPLNSRRFSKRFFAHYTFQFAAPNVVGRAGGQRRRCVMLKAAYIIDSVEL
jgi:hypothetical protein